MRGGREKRGREGKKYHMISCSLTDAEFAEFPLGGGAARGWVIIGPRDAHFWTMPSTVPLIKNIRVTDCATRWQDLLKIQC